MYSDRPGERPIDKGGGFGPLLYHTYFPFCVLGGDYGFLSFVSGTVSGSAVYLICKSGFRNTYLVPVSFPSDFPVRFYGQVCNRGTIG